MAYILAWRMAAACRDAAWGPTNSETLDEGCAAWLWHESWGGLTSGFEPTAGAMSPRSAANTVSSALGVCCHMQRPPMRPTYWYISSLA